MKSSPTSGKAHPKVVLILETSPGGHRLVYVSLLVQKAISSGRRVVLAVSGSVLRDPRLGKHLGELLAAVEIAEVGDDISEVVELQRLAHQYHASLVIVPDALKYGWRMFAGASRVRPTVRLLVMNDPRWHFRFHPSIVQRVFKLLLLKASDCRPGAEIFWLRPQGARMGVRTVIDPVVMDADVEEIRAKASTARRMLGMRKDVFWFGVVGGLDGRKNIPMVVDALEMASVKSGRKLGLALLGPWNDDEARTSAEIALSGSGVDLVSRHVQMSNEEMNVMVAALDCAVMAYSTSGPNSTTAKAAALGVRVAAAGSRQFRRFAAALTGQRGVKLKVDALATELLAAIERPAPMPRTLLGPEGLTVPLLGESAVGHD